MEIILLAVPFFFLLIGLELIAEKVRGTDYYRVNDAVTSLTTGVINQGVNILKLLVPLTLYVLVYDSLAIWNLGESWAVWAIAFVLYDFCYYWNHRLGHEMNILWAAHVVHHNSEDYNLSTALRQTGTSFLSVLFYLPMALIGFDPLMVITVGALNLVYQFWVHTQHIGRLGWVDRVLVTPSNHRVHHAQNGVYIDRNYGGVFILWDRLFGSFQDELKEDPPIYGIRGALNSFDPVWANFQVYHQLLQDSIHTNNWWYRLTIWFRRTGWRPPDVIDQYPLSKTDLADFQKYDHPISAGVKVYAIIQYVLIAGLVLSLMMNLASAPAVLQLATIAYVLWSGYAVALMMENKQRAYFVEALKLLILVAAVLILPLPQILSAAVVALAIISMAFLSWLKFSEG